MIIKAVDPTKGLGKYKLEKIKCPNDKESQKQSRKIELNKETRENIWKNDGVILRANKPAFKFFCDDHYSKWKNDNPLKTYNDFSKVRFFYQNSISEIFGHPCLKMIKEVIESKQKLI
jgi:hypothetical protein